MSPGDPYGLLMSGYNALSGQTDPMPDQKQQRQSRHQQQIALGTVGNWAMTGQGPSAAQNMVERNRAENAAQQVGMAKTMGGDPSLANRNAQEGIARGAADASYQGAVLRSQEQQQQMQNYLTGLNQLRQGDIDVYGNTLAARQQNAANKQQFWGGIMDKAGMAIGGMF